MKAIQECGKAWVSVNSFCAAPEVQSRSSQRRNRNPALRGGGGNATGMVAGKQRAEADGGVQVAQAGFNFFASPSETHDFLCAGADFGFGSFGVGIRLFRGS